jgi:hypothetical protein
VATPGGQFQKRAPAQGRRFFIYPVIASEAKQSGAATEDWIASSRSLSSGGHSPDPLAPRNDA